jgi:hypothetical protein
VSAPEGSRCAVHPEELAADVCLRCGAFTCALCVRYRGPGRVLCAACLAKGNEARAGSTMLASAAVALSVFGLATMCLVFAAPLSAVGFALGAHVLRRIRAGELTTESRSRGVIAVALGFIGVASLAVRWGVNGRLWP